MLRDNTQSRGLSNVLTPCPRCLSLLFQAILAAYCAPLAGLLEPKPCMPCVTLFLPDLVPTMPTAAQCLSERAHPTGNPM